MSDSKVIAHDRESLQDWDRIKPVLVNYAEKRGLTIDVSNPHGYVAEPAEYKPNTLWVRFYSAPPSEKRGGDIMHQACGYRLESGGCGDALRPTEKGTQIVDEDGVILAEVVGGNNIYVLFDLPHRFAQSDKVLQFILDEYDALNKMGALGKFLKFVSFEFTRWYQKVDLGNIWNSISEKVSGRSIAEQKRYIETFLDPDTKLFYKDEKEIKKRWESLVNTAYRKQVFVVNNEIFVPLGTKIHPSEQLSSTYLTLCLDLEDETVGVYLTKKPFSVKGYRQGKYEWDHPCLGNISEGVENFLKPTVREDALVVLALKEYYRQGNT
jgi:hypothetical protein